MSQSNSLPVNASTVLSRIKRIRSHAGHARFLAECDDTAYVIARQADIPSPYAYSPEWTVYRHNDAYVVIVETSHRCYDVFSVPESLLATPVQEEESAQVQSKWHYQGDVKLEYGGVFFDVSDWRWGYVTAIRIEDLDSACGFSGAVLIQKLTINVGKGWSKEKKRSREALAVFGLTRPVGQGVSRKICLAEAYMTYGFYDQDDYTPAEILQLEEDGPLTFDGWIAQPFNGDLKQYIDNKYLD